LIGGRPLLVLVAALVVENSARKYVLKDWFQIFIDLTMNWCDDYWAAVRKAIFSALNLFF
jgi:hypothetical protein